MIDEWRTETYLAHCAGSDEPANAEAGPSNFVPQHTPHMVQPPTNPSGGLSETTADAEHNKQITEEDVAPVSDFYCSHVPRVTERMFSVGSPSPVQGQGGRSICRLDYMPRLSTSCATGRRSGRGSLIPQPTKGFWRVSADPVLSSGESWSN